ncbi:MAG: hypothetical protein AAGI17_09635 [Planctomycetota bacterium]
MRLALLPIAALAAALTGCQSTPSYTGDYVGKGDAFKIWGAGGAEMTLNDDGTYDAAMLLAGTPVWRDNGTWELREEGGVRMVSNVTGYVAIAEENEDGDLFVDYDRVSYVMQRAEKAQAEAGNGSADN